MVQLVNRTKGNRQYSWHSVWSLLKCWERATVQAPGQCDAAHFFDVLEASKLARTFDSLAKRGA